MFIEGKQVVNPFGETTTVGYCNLKNAGKLKLKNTIVGTFSIYLKCVSTGSVAVVSNKKVISPEWERYIFYEVPVDGEVDFSEGEYYLYDAKFESGSKATSYTPSPEDDPIMYDNIIYDTSGYGNNGSITDSTCPTWSSDTPRYKGSYVFNGNNQYISGLSPITSSTKEFSIACWVYLNKLGITMTLFTARTAVGFGIALFVTNDKLRFYDNTRSSFNYSLQDKNWFHLCVTRNEDKKKLYINGQLVEESSDVGDMQNIGKYFTIGGSEASDTGIATDNFLNGKLSDFRIYATALSDTDILELYQSSASVDNNGNLMLAGEVIEK